MTRLRPHDAASGAAGDATASAATNSAAAFEDGAERGRRFLATLDERRVSPGRDAVEGLASFRQPFPDLPASAAEILADLDRFGSPATVASAGPRYFGFVTGGALPAAVGAGALAAAWNQNAFAHLASPVGATLEEIALEWIADALGLPDGCGGTLLTGTSMANAVGLAAARDHVLVRAGWDAVRAGLFDAPPITVIVGAEAHASLVRALGFVGLGRERVLTVPVDRQGRMRADRLPPIEAPAILCLQAGNVNTGGCDPAQELCAHAREAGAWVHVDGAFGLWAAASPEYRHLVAGFELADSWAIDAHKWLNVGYDSGALLVRDPALLKTAMGVQAAYLSTNGREPVQYGPEMSRRARGIETWAALKALGRRGLADLVERNCAFARRFAEALGAGGCTILNDVVLNQVLVSFGDADRTRRVIAAVQEDGTCWCGGTTWQGHAAMRISVSSWATTAADVERSIAAILKVASGA